MMRLLRIAMCLVAAFLLVPVEGDCSEIFEFESEIEVITECVRSTVIKESIEPSVKIIRAFEASRYILEYCHRYTPKIVNTNFRIIYCVYLE